MCRSGPYDCFNNSGLIKFLINNGTTILDKFITPFVAGIGMEIKGTVMPPDFKGLISLARYATVSYYYNDDTIPYNEVYNLYDPDGDPAYPDIDPQSGNSHGIVYDLDGPGHDLYKLNSENHPEGTLHHVRGIFRQYAECHFQNFHQCSDEFYWYTRSTLRKAIDANVWEWDDSIPGDNQNGKGPTNFIPPFD
jgi:hypothetical protein